jgi:dATP pyrophosphohydrolase
LIPTVRLAHASQFKQMKYKIPVSVLVMVYTPDSRVLLLERADRPGFWQSVTGSQEPGETLEETAIRELKEETGLDARHYRLENWHMSNRFEIYKHWSGRYAPGTTHNTEHVFGLRVPGTVPIQISPREHLAYEWVPRDEAIDKVFSWTNAAVLRALPDHAEKT